MYFNGALYATLPCLDCATSASTGAHAHKNVYTTVRVSITYIKYVRPKYISGAFYPLPFA